MQKIQKNLLKNKITPQTVSKGTENARNQFLLKRSLNTLNENNNLSANNFYASNIEEPFKKSQYILRDAKKSQSNPTLNSVVLLFLICYFASKKF